MEGSFAVSALALRQKSAAIIERWLAGYRRSRLRLPRPMDLRELAGPAQGIVEALGAALAEPGCTPGSPVLREVEKALVFVGGTLAAAPAPARAVDVVAFVQALRDVLVEEAPAPEERVALARLFDWLVALAAEGHASSQADSLRLRYLAGLERGTPVVMLPGDLPCAILVGEPDRAVVDKALARLLLSVVRVGARALVLDGSGLGSPADPAVLEALTVFGHHRQLAGVRIVLTGLDEPSELAWKAAFPLGHPIEHVEGFPEAVGAAQNRPAGT